MRVSTAICAVSMLIGVACTATAKAQESASTAAAPWSDVTLAANVTVASQYRYRGLMQTNNQPAVQGGFDILHASGFYLKNWNSSISWLADSNQDVSAPIESDFYAGYTGKIWSELAIDTGLLRYYYPGDYPSGYTSPNTTEAYVGLSYGPVAFKYSHALTNLFGFADSKNSQYYEASGKFGGFMDGVTFDVHAGYQHVNHVRDASYTDWSVGFTKTWDHGVSASLAYIDTNADQPFYTNTKGRYLGKSTALLSLTKAF